MTGLWNFCLYGFDFGDDRGRREIVGKGIVVVQTDVVESIPDKDSIPGLGQRHTSDTPLSDLSNILMMLRHSVSRVESLDSSVPTQKISAWILVASSA